MKKGIILIISFILILAMMFSVCSMTVMAKTLKDNPVPLAGGEFFGADDEEIEAEDTPLANPRTGDSMVLFILLLAGISLITITTASVMKKSRAK
jgi:hypothetical protein